MTKTSFILYTEYEELINQLSDEQCGQLFKSVFSYNNNGELPEKLDNMTKIVFTVIRQDLDRNAEKYEEMCKKMRENGKKGGRPRKIDSEIEEGEAINENQNNFEIEKEVENETEKNQKVFSKTKKSLYDNENDNENENVNEDVSLSKSREKREEYEEREEREEHTDRTDRTDRTDQEDLANTGERESGDSERILPDTSLTESEEKDAGNNQLAEKKQFEENIRLAEDKQLLDTEDREILENYIRRKKLAKKSVSAYASKLIENGDYKRIIASERARIAQKKRDERISPARARADTIQKELKSITDKDSCLKVLAKYHDRLEEIPEEFDEIRKEYDLDTDRKIEEYAYSSTRSENNYT